MVRIKFNGGNGALLCDKCGVVLATGNRIPGEYKMNPSVNQYVFCSKECMYEWLESMKKRCKIFCYGSDR